MFLISTTGKTVEQISREVLKAVQKYQQASNQSVKPNSQSQNRPKTKHNNANIIQDYVKYL